MTRHETSPNDQIGVSVEQAADLTSVSPYVIRNEINAGRIPARHINSRVAVEYAGLRDWFHAQPAVIATGETA